MSSSPIGLPQDKFEAWQRREMEQLEAIHAERMRRWAYMQTDEFRNEIAREVIEAAHNPEHNSPEESEDNAQ